MDCAGCGKIDADCEAPAHGSTTLVRGRRPIILRCSIFPAFTRPHVLIQFANGNTKREARDVDLALRLNVLAVFASFLLIGAILLGAFQVGG